MNKKIDLPKRGEFWTVNAGDPDDVYDIFVVGECKKDDEDVYGIVRKSCGVRLLYNLLNPYEIFVDDGEEVCDTSAIRPSTPEEIEFFHKTLESKGYRWDMEKFELKRIVPKPELHLRYWWIESISLSEPNPKFRVESDIWCGTMADDARYNNGVVFEKKSEALVIATKLTNAVNEILNEYKP